MASVLEAIRNQWATSQALLDLVPIERVFLGPPNPGSGLLCLGLLEERIVNAGRTNMSRFQEISVEAAAQAQTAEELEKLRDAIETELETWQSDRYGAMSLQRCEIAIRRPQQSPSRLWTGELTLTWETVRL